MVNDPCPFQGKGLSLGTVPEERAQDTWATARCSPQSPAPESRPQAQDWSCQRHPHRKAGSQSHAEALGLTMKWVQEQSHRRKPQKLGASFNPVTQSKTSPFHTLAHAAPLFRMPFLLMSLWRTPTHPSRSSSNVPSSEAFPDQMLFPHHTFWRLA